MAKLRPMGTIMLDIEKVLLSLSYKHGYSWDKVLKLTLGILETYHPENQEEYVDGGNPSVRTEGLINVSDLVKKPSKYKKLIAEMSNSHDLQWNEVLSLIQGYLQVHCLDKKGKRLKFYYGA